MRLTIFWRVILAQVSLIALILAVSLYTFSQLNRLTSLSTDALATDSTCIEEERRLLKIFLAQMRSAEKYLLLQDKVFYNYFTQGDTDFANALEKIALLLDTPQERELVEQIRDLQARYATGLTTAFAHNSAWNKEKTGFIDGITTGINDLIHLREEAIARKVTAARDQAAQAAGVVGWLTLGGLSAAVLLAYFHARSISRPLSKLAQELRRVGKGEFDRSLEIRAPREVGELAQAFNWMRERLAELDAMKTAFVAHVSHELRTPLTAMQEGTALLLEEIPGPLTVSQREILEVVRSHSERLFRTLSSVLDLSKMEAGMMEYVPVPTDLAPVIDRSVETMRLIAQKKGVQLEATCASPLPLLFLDEARIQQVLDNLLGNAMKFTPQGGVIKVSAAVKRNRTGQESWVEVRVSDTGAGIPAEEVERIFDRFYQSPYHRGQSQRGTGLGLAIARYIVEAHGGKIWAESQVGQGSTFVFTLPIHSPEQDKGRIAVVTPGQQRRRELRRGGVLRFLFHSGPQGLLFLILLSAGCTRVLSYPGRASLLAFPPQKVMEDGNYQAFVAENEERLRQCQGEMGCDTALFNLGFAYAYVQNPHRDLAKALQYFGELLKQYPQSPWALQGQAWIAFISENLALGESRRQLQADLRTREAMVRSLRAQLDRSRAIDIEMEKKERELLR